MYIYIYIYIYIYVYTHILGGQVHEGRGVHFLPRPGGRPTSLLPYCYYYYYYYCYYCYYYYY